MQRIAFFVYGVGCHLLFLATYACLAAFVGGYLLPKTIDGPATTPLPVALGVNLALVLGFGLQHSIMARPAFKRVWTRWIPQPIERSTYVFVSCLATLALVAAWQPIDITIWNVQQPLFRTALVGLFAAGWLMVPVVSLLINHFDLFGTRQVWLHLQGKPYTPLAFRTPGLYAYVRHPLYLGWALAFWATPTMTLGHLVFAGAMTLYMVLAAHVEERDLVDHFGPQYEEYRRRVPMFVPRVRTPQPEPATQSVA